MFKITYTGVLSTDPKSQIEQQVMLDNIMTKLHEDLSTKQIVVTQMDSSKEGLPPEGTDLCFNITFGLVDPKALAELDKRMAVKAKAKNRNTRLKKR